MDKLPVSLTPDQSQAGEPARDRIASMTEQRSLIGRLRDNLAVLVAGTYAVISLCWIATTDRWLLGFADTLEATRALQTNKGWLFVVGTSLVLFFLLRHFCQAVSRERHTALATVQLMENSLAASGSAIWNTDLETRLVEMSPALRLKLGLPLDTAITLEDWAAYIHPDDRSGAVAGWRHNLREPNVEHTVRHRIKGPNGEEFWLEMRGRGIPGPDGTVTRVAGVAIDVTRTLRAEERANEVANYDMLTGLPNQRKFREELETRLARLQAGDNESLVVCRIDINRFADVNSSVGVSGGDEVLRLLGSRLRKTCGTGGLVTRLAADEFGLLLHSDGDMERIQSDVRALAVVIREPMQFGGVRLDLSASIGVAVAPTDGLSPETLMINADLALNRARKAQSDRPCFYATGMNEDFKARAQLSRELQTAIRSQSIRIFFQPIIRSKDRRLLGFEALARWRHPERGDVPPALFIPLAEELGLISQITQYMLREACFHLSSWNRQFGRDWLVAVNLSGKELSSPDLHRQVASVLSKTGLDPQCLELEVTENALTENMDLAATNLGRLRSIGVSLAIDDFGTGYSSLVALRRLPVSRLKIDRSFMKDYGVDQEDTAIVNSIIQLAKTLDLQLTAEGIEDEKTFTQVRSKGCQNVQGYMFGRPQSATDTLTYLSRRVEEEKLPPSRARAS